MPVPGGLKNMGGDLISSITGNIDRACIIVHDARESAKKLEKEDVPNTKFGAITKAVNDVNGKVDDAAEKAKEVLGQAPTGKSNDINSEDKIFFVQFNPSSIELYSASDTERKVNLSDEPGNQGTTDGSPVPPLAEMTTTLIFDQMNVYDSFMFDKVSGANISTATNLASGLVKTFSVQPYVEGFISALRNGATRIMTFQWADFSFSGFLVNVNATYTMFSVSGHPVRAVVQLRIRQKVNSEERKKWRKDFKTMVGNKESFTTAGQRVSNMLNLSL